jgi:hypothetical protein
LKETTFENKVAILAELWVGYGEDEAFEDFFSYNDLGLPLAYALDNDIVVANERTRAFIEETFALLLETIDCEDIGFESLDSVLAEAEQG